MTIITANVALISLNQRFLGFTIDEVIAGSMWVIGTFIVILMFLEIITIKMEPKPVDNKRDWCKTKENDDKKEF